jgi:hypothetical protein
MAQKNKILPYIIFGVPIAIGLYFVYKAIRKSLAKGKDAPDNYNPQENSQVESNSKGGITPSVKKLFPLRKGSKGGKVIELQNAILQYDNTLLGKYGADGDFGSITEKALQTILGKTSADSQDDIDAIISKTSKKKSDAETMAKQKVVDDNRNILASKLIAEFKKNPSVKDWYACSDTQIQKGKYTSDGRTPDNKFVIIKKGDRIQVGSSSTFTTTPNGMIEIRDPYNMNYYLISPYGFEIK